MLGRNVSVNSDGNLVSVQNAKKAEKQQNVKEKGSIRASLAASVAQMAPIPLSLAGVKGMQHIAGTLTAEQKDAMNNTAEQIIKSTKLAEKGVNIKNISEKDIINIMPIPDKFADLANPINAIAHGKNAGFSTSNCAELKNTILINKDKLPTAVFHEIGHAYNYNNSKFWRAMQGARTPAMAVASLIALIPAFTVKEEAKDGEELTKAQKAKNFVREKSPILAAAAMLPVVAEESMASIRAAQWVKTNLPKDLAKKVNKTNILGAISYVGATAGMALAAFVGLKVKDKIMEKQKAKAEMKNQQVQIPINTEKTA